MNTGRKQSAEYAEELGNVALANGLFMRAQRWYRIADSIRRDEKLRRPKIGEEFIGDWFVNWQKANDRAYELSEALRCIEEIADTKVQIETLGTALAALYNIRDIAREVLGEELSR